MHIPYIPILTYTEIHKLMPIVCVDCVISRDDKILLIKRKLEPMKDDWWFPGGRLLRNERLVKAVPRIIGNEIGAIGNTRPVLLGTDETTFDADPFGHGAGTHTINFVYACEIAYMQIVLDKDHSDYSWFSYEEIYKSMDPYVKRFTALAEGLLRQK